MAETAAATDKKATEQKPETSTAGTTSGPAAAVKAPQASGKIIRRVPPGSRRANRAKERRRTGPFIKYVGEASQRKISAADWKSLGLKGVNAKDEDHDLRDYEWNFSNERMIESTAFSEDQLDYLLIDDLQPNGTHSFLEVDYNDNGELDQIVYEEDQDAE